MSTERRKIIPPSINQTTGEPSWRWRRVAFFMVLIFSLVMMWRLVDNDDTALNYAVAVGMVWLAAALVLIYTGFATAQDIIAIFVARSGRPYASQAGSVETTTKTTVTPDPNTPAPVEAPSDPASNPPPGYAS